MLAFFGYISAFLSIVCFLPYIRDIVRGKTKPQRTSWLIWSILGSTIFFSQLAEGGAYSLLLPGAKTLVAVCIFLLSVKYGMGGTSKFDRYALIAAAIGLIVWLATDNAVYAFTVAIIVDAIGGLLTIVKAYKQPETETLISWVLSGLAGVFAALAVGELNFFLLLYPVYIAFISFTIALAVVWRQQKGV